MTGAVLFRVERDSAIGWHEIAFDCATFSAALDVVTGQALEGRFRVLLGAKVMWSGFRSEAEDLLDEQRAAADRVAVAS